MGYTHSNLFTALIATIYKKLSAYLLKIYLCSLGTEYSFTWYRLNYDRSAISKGLVSKVSATHVSRGVYKMFNLP